MTWFYNMKVSTKLLSGFVLVAMIAGIIGWVGVKNLRNIAAKDMMMYSDMLVPIAELSRVSTAFQRVRVNLAKVLLVKDKANKEKYQLLISNLSSEITTLTDKLNKAATIPEEKALLREFDECRKVFRPIISRIIELSLAGKDDEALALYEGEATEAARAELAVIEKLEDFLTKKAQQGADNNSAVARSAVRFTLIFSVFGILLAVGLGVVISRMITVPLTRGVEFAHAVAGGDLTRRLAMCSKDEIGCLSDALDDMVEKLRDIMGNITNASDTVSSAAVQLSASSEQMATGTEEVAAQAGTVATAGEEMAATSMEIAQNCSMVAESSQLANDSAITGAAIVQETVTLMNRIAERVKDSAQAVESLGSRSDQIGEIIGTIEDIADQTNLLALNAAIEAARAGEQGRGFAVVADEVRALAERTTKATKEIGQMIKAIQSETKSAVHVMEEGVREVENGTVEAAKSGKALQEILDQIHVVTMQVSQIATAAEQQTATTTEISSNMQQITDVIQDTAKGAEESASAANQLARMAEELQSLAGQFRLVA
ncbi:MAG: methyl-accepting chemotaxis protein [Deltaproteobacteria bacterium]|nr:methyl-accepting chemotaxis protein [Deltaproteobacteria bacterium]